MAALALKAQLPEGVGLDEVRDVLSGALRQETELARARQVHFERACLRFEQQYGISSDVFMGQFEAGVLGDDAAYFDWYAAKRGFDLWTRKLTILSGVSA